MSTYIYFINTDIGTERYTKMYSKNNAPAAARVNVFSVVAVLSVHEMPAICHGIPTQTRKPGFLMAALLFISTEAASV